MNESTFVAALRTALQANGWNVSGEVQEKFAALSSFLVSENEKMNLTAITDQEGIAVRHICDCVLAAGEAFFPVGATVADIGAGAGFPTLPLAIVRPDLHITAVDATAKRVTFIQKAASHLGLKHVTAVCARAEEMGRTQTWREQFDVVCARAVARMQVLCEWCLPLVRCGGQFVALKGPHGAEECIQADNAIKLLGGGRSRVVTLYLNDPFAVPMQQLERQICVIQKITPTPQKYPRSNAQIMKKPLA